METFDFMKFAAGTNFPTDTVSIYTDADAAYHLEKIESKIAHTLDADELKSLEAQAEVLRDKFKASEMKITMRGIPIKREKQYIKDADEKFGKEDTEERRDWETRSFIAAHIVSVENAEGQVDKSEWDADKVDTLFNLITLEGITRIKNKAQELTVRSDIFENVEVNSDF